MARNQVMRISEIKTKVLALLEEKEEYRDNDEKLVARYWADQLKGAGKALKKEGGMSAYELLVMLGNGGLRSGEDIIRTRRILQNLHPEVQGKKYAERHKDGKQTAKEIVDFPKQNDTE